MKTRLFTFIARALLFYQLVKFVKILTRLMNRYTEHRLGVQRNYGPPRTTYRR